MPNCVCNGAKLKCSFGNALGTMTVTSQFKVSDVGTVASIMDNKLPNLGNFGMCQTLSNPAVAAATAAALGTLTPQPCVPNITAPWTPGKPTVLIGSNPALTNTSKLMCAYGGVIEVMGTPPVPKTSL